MLKKLPYLLVLLALVLPSCESKKSQDSRQILRLNLADDPSSFDPRIARRLRDLTLAKQLYEGLVRIDEKFEPQLALAERIEVSEDCLTYTFKLKESFWNNGDPVTAYDFEHAWLEALDPCFPSDYSYMLYPIKNARLARMGKCHLETVGVIALDEKTLVVQLETPTPYFLELTAFPTYFPVHHKEGVFSESDNLICNGPFQLKEWKTSSEVQLEKNMRYWDKEHVKLDGILLTIIRDGTTESHLFEKNQLDWLGQPISHNISSEAFEKLKKEGKVSSYPIAGTLWFTFNTQKTPFDSVHFRKAFAYALNRQEIIQHILLGNQTIATSPVPPSIQPLEKPYFEDAAIDEAKEQFSQGLAEKGWTLESFPKIILQHSSSERSSKIAQLVQQQWRKALGVNIQLEMIELQAFNRNVKEGHFQIGFGEWIADFLDPLAFLELFKYTKDSGTGNGMNDTGWHNPEFSKLLDMALNEKNKETRKKLLQTAESILMDEMPIAPLYHFAFDFAKKEYVQNVVLSPLGVADFKYAEIK